MALPVKLSDALVLDARLEGELQQRSIAGQVEYWARLGKTTAQLFTGRQVNALQAGAALGTLSEAIAMADSPEGRARVNAVLARRPYPHFEQHPRYSDLLIRIDQDGKRTAGRFVNRRFVAVKRKGPAAASRKVAPSASGRAKA